MAEKLKSALELAMEKADKMGGDEIPILTGEQKVEIASIRKIYEAKVAEVEILVQDKEKKELELDRLRRERERKVESVYEKAKKRTED
jgi:ribosomal protein L23